MTELSITYYDSTISNKFNDKKEYYTISEKNIVYIGTFPIEWAHNCEETTGPENCNNCYCYGSVNGVFIGYCANCADYVYEGNRGKGFIDNGVEISYDDEYERTSSFCTYLKDIDIDSINIENVDMPIDTNNPYNIDQSEITSEDYYPDDEDRGGNHYTEFGSDFNGGYDSY